MATIGGFGLPFAGMRPGNAVRPNATRGKPQQQQQAPSRTRSAKPQAEAQSRLQPINPRQGQTAAPRQQQVGPRNAAGPQFSRQQAAHLMHNRRSCNGGCGGGCNECRNTYYIPPIRDGWTPADDCIYVKARADYSYVDTVPAATPALRLFSLVAVTDGLQITTNPANVGSTSSTFFLPFGFDQDTRVGDLVPLARLTTFGLVAEAGWNGLWYVSGTPTTTDPSYYLSRLNISCFCINDAWHIRYGDAKGIWLISDIDRPACTWNFSFTGLLDMRLYIFVHINACC